MIEMIKRLIRSFKREKNWKERTSDAPTREPDREGFINGVTC